MPKREFRNWSGSTAFTPDQISEPTSERAVIKLVKKAKRKARSIRPVGSGHSSTPLMSTDDSLVTLGRMTGVVEADPVQGWAKVLPGTGLRALGAELAEHGLAMENLGDVDYQAIAGAVSTATHGSGITLGNLSSTLIGGRLVNGEGEVVPFGFDAGEGEENPLLRAAQVSLGSLGILTSLTLRLEPAHQLHRMNWMTHIDWVLENFEELVRTNRSVDFYWYPRSDMAQVRMLNKPGEEPDLTPSGELKRDITGPNYEIIPNDRALKFEEMEYMLPLDTSLEAFRQVRERIREHHRAKVGWRVLVRTIAPDLAMLSTAQHRATMTIALLQNNTLPFQDYFDDIEPLFQTHGGRPHWGKKHTMQADRLSRLYPEWDHFQEIRREMDPEGLFMNDHLHDLFTREGE